jgi:hypothetical protein
MDNIITDKKEALALLQKGDFEAGLQEGKIKNTNIPQKISESLLHNKEFVLEALQHNGNKYFLKFASEDLQNDKEVVLKAVA